MNELAELRDGVIASMKGFVTRSLEPWVARIKALEDRAPLKGEKGDPGADGKSVDVAALSVQIIEAAAKAVDAIPKPKDGRDFDPEVLDASVKRHVEALPKAINGKDGASGIDGKDGHNGVDGKDGSPGQRGEPGVAGKDGTPGKDADPEAIAASVLAIVMRELDKIPAPKDGKDGQPGRDGKDGVDGKDGAPGLRGEAGINGKDGADGLNGKDGAPGRDGKDGADGLQGKDGAPGERGLPGDPGQRGEKGLDGEAGRDGRDADVLLVRGEVERAMASMPKPENGKDADPEFIRSEIDRAVKSLPPAPAGADGLGFDDMNVEFDNERTVTLRFERGGRRKDFSIRLPVQIDRGTFKTGGAGYEVGDCVTYGGSYWVATRDTKESPSDARDGFPWRMVMRKPKDGRDGKDA